MAGRLTEFRRERPGFFAIVTAAAGLVVAWLVVRAIWGGRIRPGLLDERAEQIPNQPVATVLSEKLPVRREVIGSVQSRVPVEAASRVSARVTEVRVHAGDRVSRDQILVTLDASDLRAQVAQAHGQLTAAQGDLDRAAADKQRFSALFARGSVTAHEHDAAEAAYSDAAGRVAQARAALAAAQAGLEYATVRSPVAGVVVERLTEPGDLAMPGKPLVRLYDENALRVQLEVPEDLARYIELGTLLDVTVAGNGVSYHTQVNEIVPASDPSSRIFLIRAPLPSGQRLQPGMFARASFTAGAETVLTVPRDAIQEVGQLETARIVSDGKVETRMVSLGRRLDRRVEVLAGLRAGDRVLLDHPAAQGR
ncbi:MAG TPA: efflux RND transporter periplasmic adaptor subunit [Candidatus Binataceae bacterium]|nr:efflux RND transporter periplasmic adaptor subunit [Candidatus Binataceae bacterium]